MTSWNFGLLQYAVAESESEVAQSCLTLCDPMDCSLPESSVHGIFQTRILEWVAISFSRRSSRPRDRTRVSRIVGRCFTIWATREAKKGVNHHSGTEGCDLDSATLAPTWTDNYLLALTAGNFSILEAREIQTFLTYIYFLWGKGKMLCQSS